MKTGIITMVINNEPDLASWVDYHRKIGFDSFFIINASNEDIDIPDAEIINEGRKDIFYTRDYYGAAKTFNGIYHDNICRLVERFKQTGEIDWIIILDTNQFIRSCDDIHNVLDNFISLNEDPNNILIKWKNIYVQGKPVTKLRQGTLNSNEISFYNVLMRIDPYLQVSHLRMLPNEELCRGNDKKYHLRSFNTSFLYIDIYKTPDLDTFMTDPVWFLRAVNYSKDIYYRNIFYIFYIYNYISRKDLERFLPEFPKDKFPAIYRYLKYMYKNRLWETD